MKQNPLKKETLPVGLGKILVAHLIPDKKNPRKDLKKGDPEFEKINKSVEKFGQLDPIIFNTRTRKVIGGHQRLKVLDSKGYTELYTVTLGAYTWAFAEADLKELSDKEESAANIALNKAQGDWEIDQLTANLQELKLEGLLDVTGFDDKEFDAMIRELHKDDEPQDSEPQISRAEELRKEWGTELGQMWQCGEHRVICGDCTDPAVVARVMQGDKADMVFTDPPYNCGDRMKDGLYAHTDSPAMKGLSKAKWDEGFNPTKLLSVLSEFKPQNGSIYICTSHMLAPAYWDWCRAEKATLDGFIVWVKDNPMPSLTKRHWTWGAELIIYATFGKHVFNYPDGEHALNWWNIPSNSANKLHPTEKPVPIPLKAIQYSSAPGAVILDPFLGSGTTMIACENLGRKCRGCEISPEYVAVILQRYQDTFPGKEIRLIE